MVTGQGITYKPCNHRQAPAFRSCILPWSEQPFVPGYNRGVDHMVSLEEEFAGLTSAEPPRLWKIDQSGMDVDEI